MHSVAICLTGLAAGNIAMPDSVGLIAQRETIRLSVIGIVKAKLNEFGTFREQCEIDTVTVPVCTKWGRASLFYHGFANSIGLRRQMSSL